MYKFTFFLIQMGHNILQSFWSFFTFVRPEVQALEIFQSSQEIEAWEPPEVRWHRDGSMISGVDWDLKGKMTWGLRYFCWRFLMSSRVRLERFRFGMMWMKHWWYKCVAMSFQTTPTPATTPLFSTFLFLSEPNNYVFLWNLCPWHGYQLKDVESRWFFNPGLYLMSLEVSNLTFCLEL